MSEQTRYWCPQCGPDGPGDEDGCCARCGATAVGRGAELALWERQEMIRLRARVEELEEVVEASRLGVAAVRELISESRGVAGLHLNGDEAPWDELLAGGQYESWLIQFCAAEEVLVAFDGEVEP